MNDNETLISDTLEAVSRALLLVSRTQKMNQFDQRMLALSYTNLQQGFMWYEKATEFENDAKPSAN